MFFPVPDILIMPLSFQFLIQSFAVDNFIENVCSISSLVNDCVIDFKYAEAPLVV